MKQLIDKQQQQKKNEPSACSGPDITKETLDVVRPCIKNTTFFPFFGGDCGPPAMRCNCNI